MKKFLVVLLSLGLIMAFSMTASAATSVKFSGQYYVVGWYDNNPSRNDTDNTWSRAAFWQRTRVKTDFQVAEGLTFTTRFDALEKQWGNSDWTAGAQATTDDKSNSRKNSPNPFQLNTNAQENLEFEQGYVTFATKIGKFQIGYQPTDEWGTGFADIPGARPRFLYAVPIGPVTGVFLYEKLREADFNAVANAATRMVDADGDVYALGGIYKFKGGEAGMLWKYTAYANNRLAVNPFRTQIHAFNPYMKGTFGPVYIEAELVYITGKQAKYEAPSVTADVDREGYGAYIMAKVNLGPAYVGGQFGLSSGDDAQDPTKNKTGPVSSTAWSPSLFFANANYRSWHYGVQPGNGNANGNSAYITDKTNFAVVNAFAGFNPTPKWNVEAGISYMWAPTKPYVGAVQYESGTLGTEYDLKATYKIFDNLTYMVGAGYFVTGDFFKRINTTGKVGNDYMLMNQLTLNF